MVLEAVPFHKNRIGYQGIQNKSDLLLPSQRASFLVYEYKSLV